ncbi:MAG TPA: aldo/keto reductase, partial [Methylomirabilota bacterium]|nr:aldo/keto reductase [Methylomirabilota bacterium]
NYFDTAPMYGHGLSEARIGEGLRWRPRDRFVLSTKVGRLLKAAPRSSIDFAPWVDALPNQVAYDYSYDGAMRSIEDSLQRLGLERIDIAWIHDVDGFIHPPEQQKIYFREAMDGAAKALLRLREEGVVASIGLGVNEWQPCHQALLEHDFDSFLLAGRYTLLEQDALDAFLPLCETRNAAVVVGGGYNSGILATGARPGAKYNYAPAPDWAMQRVANMEEVCAAFDVPLAAAALQFVLAHPCVPAIVPGTRTVDQLLQNVKLIDYPIPADFWRTLKDRRLIREDAPTP